MRFKKQISIFISILLVLTSIQSSGLFAFADENERNPKTELLYKTGIFIESERKDEFSDTYITRGEFIKRVVRFFNMPITTSTQNVFWDVDDANEYASAVHFAYDLGLVVGYSDKSFKPYDKISQSDAVAVVMSLLGYREMGKASGGYDRLAASIELTKGFNTDGYLTYSDTFNLLTNALTAPIMDQTSYGENAEYSSKDKNTILSKYFDIYYMEDIVYADRISYLGSGGETASDSILVGSTYLNYDYADTKRFVGYLVNCYYKQTGNETPSVVYMYEDQNETYTIDTSDFDSLDGNKLKYYSGDKLKTVSFNYNTIYFLNGKSVDYATYYNDALFTSDNGKITFVDNNADSSYDVVFVTKYTNVVVNYVNTQDGYIFDKNDNTIRYTSDDGSIISTLTTSDGEAYLPENLKEWDVVSTAQSLDEKYVEMIVSYKNISGSIDAYNSTKKVMEFGTNEYDVLSDVYSEDKLETLLGESVTLYLDFCDNVAAVRLGAQDANDRFALLMYAEPFENKTVKMELFEEFGGDPVVLDLAQNVRIDGVKYKKVDDMVTELKSLKEYSDHDFIGTFIRFKTDDNGNINMIDTHKVGENEEEISLRRKWTREDSTLAYKSSGAINVRYYKNSDTKYYGVPNKASLDKGDDECEMYGGLTNDTSYLMDIYQMGDDTVYYNAVIVERNTALTNEKVDNENKMWVVDNITQVINKKDDLCKKLYLVNGSGTAIVEVYPDKMSLIENIDFGDVIRYGTSLSGELNAVHHIYDYSEKSFVGGAISNHRDHNQTYCGTVMDVYDEYAKVALKNKSDVVAANGIVEEGDMQNQKIYGYIAEVGRDNISFSAASPNTMLTYKNIGSDAYTILIVMQYNQPIDMMFIK